MFIYLRSILFDLFFYTFTAVYLVVCWPIMAVMPRQFVVYMARAWTRICFGALSRIVGLDYIIRGQEYLDEALATGACIIACKHQSAFETILCHVLLPDFVIVLKKQLLAIPVFGQYLKKLSSITIDRENGTASLRSLIEQSREAIKNKHSIFIFPEGTRSTPGEVVTYQRGISILYRELNVPVVPIALNSGVFWGRRSFVRRPGTIIIDIKPMIEAGLDRNLFMQTLEDTIESASQELLDIPVIPKKKRIFRKIIGTLVTLSLCAGMYGYFQAKNSFQKSLAEAGVQYAHMNFSMGISTLPCCKLSNVSFMITPEVMVTAHKVRLTPTYLRSLTLEAKGVSLIMKKLSNPSHSPDGGSLFMIKVVEALIEKRSNGYDVPWFYLDHVALGLDAGNTHVIGGINGHLKRRVYSVHFMTSLSRDTNKNVRVNAKPAISSDSVAINDTTTNVASIMAPLVLPMSNTELANSLPLPILHVKGDIDTNGSLKGVIGLQTTIGGILIAALTEKGVLSPQQADTIRAAFKPVEHDDNPELRQVTFSFQPEGIQIHP